MEVKDQNIKKMKAIICCAGLCDGDREDQRLEEEEEIFI